ncbi:MAG TPA: LacI family DNA-binding transcriptional regulator [Microbacteriaceae bacterium]|nr:LacI family DNA-binding transcriptional regulator [Microbacteriaceae bacterium]
MTTGSSHGMQPPPSIALVRDFVNTVEWQVDEDSWTTPGTLASWLSTHTGVPTKGLKAEDLRLARRIREGLRTVLLMNAGHDPLETSIDDLNGALRELPIQLSFDARGSAMLSAVGESGIGEPLTAILSAVEAARADGTWVRLKACSRDSCRWAYWDGSRNRTGRWCSMTGCGNYIKMRRRNGHDPADHEVIGHEVIGAATSAGARRVPTMVDVAGRAGVSIKTVSNVVTGTWPVAESTRSRVEAVIAELDYRPNLAARALRTGQPLLPNSG